MNTHIKENREFHRVSNSSGNTGSYSQTSLEEVLLSVASIRLKAFRARFGREPLSDEPLFFNAEADSPVQACPAQVRAQVIDACREAGVPLSIAEFLESCTR
jgi:hypothetical protein